MGTKEYYSLNAKEYIAKTFNVDMSEIYQNFLPYFKKGDKILDVGFGSGRDSLYFQENGLEVYSIDTEDEFISHGLEIGLKHPCKLDIMKLEEFNTCQGVFSSASLLHLTKKELKLALIKIDKALKNRGILYVSFKYGSNEVDEIDGRHFIYLNEKSLLEYLEDTDFKIEKLWVSEDKMARVATKWLNVILLKFIR